MPHRSFWPLWSTEELGEYFGIDPSEVERYGVEREERKQSLQDETVGQVEVDLSSQPMLYPGEVWSLVRVIESAQGEGVSASDPDNDVDVEVYSSLLQLLLIDG